MYSHASGSGADQFAEGVRPALFDELVRIEFVREGQDAEVDVLGQEAFDGPFGGVAAGFVAVVHEHDLRGEAADRRHMLIGQGRAERPDRVRDPRLMQGDAVGIPLGDDDVLRHLDPVAGLAQRVDEPALVEHRRLRAVPVLAVGIVPAGEHATAEADWLRPFIPDREDDPVDEVVVVALSIIALADELGRFEHLRGELPTGLADQPLPLVRVIAEAELLDRRVGQAAAVPQIVQRFDGAGVVAIEHRVELGLRPEERFHQLGLVLLGWAAARSGILLGQLQAGSLGQHLQRFAEADLGLFHHEGEAVPPVLQTQQRNVCRSG